MPFPSKLLNDEENGDGNSPTVSNDSLPLSANNTTSSQESFLLPTPLFGNITLPDIGPLESSIARGTTPASPPSLPSNGVGIDSSLPVPKLSDPSHPPPAASVERKRQRTSEWVDHQGRDETRQRGEPSVPYVPQRPIHPPPRSLTVTDLLVEHGRRQGRYLWLDSPEFVNHPIASHPGTLQQGQPSVAQSEILPAAPPTAYESRGHSRGISRTTQACDPCRRSKTRCQGAENRERTCNKCIQASDGRECTFQSVQRRRGPAPGPSKSRPSAGRVSSNPLPILASSIRPGLEERRMSGLSRPSSGSSRLISPEDEAALPPIRSAPLPISPLPHHPELAAPGAPPHPTYAYQPYPGYHSTAWSSSAVRRPGYTEFTRHQDTLPSPLLPPVRYQPRVFDFSAHFANQSLPAPPVVADRRGSLFPGRLLPPLPPVSPERQGRRPPHFPPPPE